MSRCRNILISPLNPPITELTNLHACALTELNSTNKQPQDQSIPPSIMAKCVCAIKGDLGGVVGILRLSQASEDAPTVIQGEIKGLTPGSHAISINVFGDLSDSSTSCAGIFNPFGTKRCLFHDALFCFS